jgi:hypothetical protein
VSRNLRTDVLQQITLRGINNRSTHIDTEQLASTAPSHSTSADKHPRTPTGTRARVANGTSTRALPKLHLHPQAQAQATTFLGVVSKLKYIKTHWYLL